MTNAEDDVAQAVIALWTQTPALAALVNAPLHDELPQPQPAVYCQLTVTKEGARPNERMTGAVFHDYRKVTLTLYANDAPTAKAGLDAMLATFNLKLGADPKRPTLKLPSLARFVRWWPLGDGQVEKDQNARSGKWVHRAIVAGEVWTVRTD